MEVIIFGFIVELNSFIWWRCTAHNLINDQVCQVQTWSLGLYFLLSVWHLLLMWQYRAAAGTDRRGKQRQQQELSGWGNFKNRTILYLLNFLSFHWWGCRVLISISKIIKSPENNVSSKYQLPVNCQRNFSGTLGNYLEHYKIFSHSLISIFQSTSLEIYWHHKTLGIQTGLEISGFGAK